MLTPRYSGCIYIATNKHNGRAYIGKTVTSLIARKASHKCSAMAGKGRGFAGAIRKWGWRAFTWAKLFESNCERTLLAAEVALIAEHRAMGFRLYNLTPGGEGVSIPCSAERKRKLSATITGRRMSQEVREAASRRMMGRKMTPEAIEKMRATKTGKKLAPWTPERRAKYLATWRAKLDAGYRPTDETRQRQSEAAKRRVRATDAKVLRERGKKGAAARWGESTS